MRYTLLLHYGEPAEGELSAETIAAGQAAFNAYGKALASAGVLVGAEVLEPTKESTTVTLRTGSLQVQDGPFAETKEALAGIFVIEVPDRDAAIGWAEKCPAAQWGVVEVRGAATSLRDGVWTAGCTAG
ncbi:YciI family protein [Pseudonocardia kunmingensis]|uniref:YCII-related domain-containing protein n=1 Tax=Pseudonocardia kunmingensis TaxID=630975 RepID=A0A543DLK7_9PSEU|nr:YciI family protein [Pseudonocardia kunmingensis]TQM10208.1 hypothetical protein FB558_5993 [Pseudonocardia kunmingensis]